MVPEGYWTLPFAVSLFVWICFFSLSGQSQTSCPNSNFSTGDFTNWEGYYGDFKDPAKHKGFAPTHHTIFHAPAPFDLNTCDSLNPIPPGEVCSARLGNDIGSQAEQLRYTVNVTEENNLFIYKYAVVFQNQPHNPDEQPNFTIEVTDSSGNVIDPFCGYYFVYAETKIPTWHSCKDIVWKEWTIVGIDLTPYLGQTVTIVFTTRDCALNIHYGYAYLSAYCSPAVLTFTFCPGDTIATVTAPPGFHYLWSNGDTTRSTIIHDPVAGIADSCVLTSVNGCKVTVYGKLKPVIVKAGFQCPPQGCTGTEVRFHDSSTVAEHVITTRNWDFGDGSPVITNIQNPSHVYDSAGIYQVTLIVTCDGGCPDTITKTLEIVPAPEVHFSISSPCDGDRGADTLYFSGQAQLNVMQGYDHYSWNTGGTTGSILVTAEGWYKVTVSNAGLCYATDSVLMLKCDLPLIMPNAFTPNDDGTNDLFRPAIRFEGITGFHMFIFDQWGSRIFETGDIRTGWDGTVNGEPVPCGVYVYTITYAYGPDESKKLTGTFTLVR